MTPTDQSCNNCRFYLNIPVATGEKPSGKCRRFPPLRIAPNTGSYSPVTADSWCGEWSALTAADLPELPAPAPETEPQVKPSKKPVRPPSAAPKDPEPLAEIP